MLLEREALQSTGIGEGVAIPHGKLPGLDRLVATFARSPQGVDFDSIDGQPTHHFFLLVVPEHSGGQYLKALARISRFFRDATFRQQPRRGREPRGRAPRDRGRRREALAGGRRASDDDARRARRGGRLGVLLLGPSGIGKSECALELVRADTGWSPTTSWSCDRGADGELIGAAPERDPPPHGDPRARDRSTCRTCSGRRRCATRCRSTSSAGSSSGATGASTSASASSGRRERSAACRCPCVTLPARPGGSIATVVEVAVRDQRQRAARGRTRRARLDERLRSEMQRLVTAPKPRIVFVSGLSGSGKTTAMAALEDLGFYCVDNLPVQLIEQFLDLCAKANPPIEKIALALDAREPAFLAAVPAVVEQLRGRGAEVDVLFLDCADEVLVSRYRETRRVHPLAPAGSVEEGIALERALLDDVARARRPRDRHVRAERAPAAGGGRPVRRGRGAADGREPRLLRLPLRYARGGRAALRRALPAEPVLRGPRCARRPGATPRSRVRARERARRGAARAAARLARLPAAALRREGKAYLTIGIGCTGGRHRSVRGREALASELRASGREVNVEHRDVEKGA